MGEIKPDGTKHLTVRSSDLAGQCTWGLLASFNIDSSGQSKGLVIGLH